MSTELIKNPGFCVHPFITRYRDLKGNDCLCCWSKTPVDFDDTTAMDQLRSSILNGQKISHCDYCYQQESRGEISARQRESVQWLKDQEVSSYINSWQPNTTDRVFFYDLRYDNKCNLACISCGPVESSLWAKELGIPIRDHKNDLKIDQLLQAKKIYMAGGEPLIINEFLDLIKVIGQQSTQPELVINTNLTRINDDIKQYLEKIQKLTLMISVDSHGKINEYHRWPMSWDKFLQNLSWVRTIGCHVMFNTVVDAVSLLGLGQMKEIEHYADKWNLTILENPKPLQINNLPDHLKNKLLQQDQNEIKDLKFYKTDIVFKSRIDVALSMLQKSGDTESLRDFIKAIDDRRKLDHREFLGVDLT